MVKATTVPRPGAAVTVSEETQAIKPSESFLRPASQITIFRLRNRRDHAGREAVRSPPFIEGVLRHRLLRIERWCAN